MLVFVGFILRRGNEIVAELFQSETLLDCRPILEPGAHFGPAQLIVPHARRDQFRCGFCGGPQGKIISCEGSEGSSGSNHDGLHRVAARV